MNAFVQELWTVSLALAPWLLLGAAIAGVLHVVLPPNFVRRHLEGRGGVLKSVALGVPLPLCSCGVIPTGLGLKKDGASDGATIGFLISTPQTGVDSLFVSASFLGWPFAFFKLFSATVTGIVGGLWADHGRNVEVHLEAGTDEPAPPRTLRAAVDHSLEVLRTIWKWLVFGVVVSAAIGAFVPDAFLQGIAAHGTWIALLAALVVSLPLYVCATASVPIAAALVAGGFPPGAALVFLMAGPATNVATLGAVYRTLGRRSLLIYLTTIVVGSVGLGYLFSFVLEGSATMAHHHHGDPSVLAMGSVAFLAGLIGWFAVEDLRSWRSSSAPAEACDLTVGVDGMTCQGCVRRLEGKLRDASGVTDVRVDLEGKTASVRGEIDEARIRELVREAGFTPVG
jgi:uncharacterized membrane protein YraQ (UPF0718 family)/copper chaperone CopZ